jgi:hypothetical protein
MLVIGAGQAHGNKIPVSNKLLEINVIRKAVETT